MGRVVQRARTLRKSMTDAEVRLWSRLRQLRPLGYHIRRQTPFGPYVADFSCHRAKLIVEVDGGQHNEPINRQRDRNRSAHFERSGYVVLRFWNDEVLANTDGVVETILAVLKDRSARPPPGDAAHHHPHHIGGGKRKKSNLEKVIPPLDGEGRERSEQGGVSRARSAQGGVTRVRSAKP